MNLPNVTIEELLEAGVHFGHSTRRWNPKMEQYIFGVRNKIHIIDLRITLPLLNNALVKLYETANKSGKILFVGTIKQCTEIVKEISTEYNQYYINKRWLGGTLTNWKTISNSIKRLEDLGYHVLADKEIKQNQGELGNLWAVRIPKIKIVHMLVDPDGEREKESIRHLKKLSEFSGWKYEQLINPLYKDLPPKDTCARPDDVQIKPGEYKLTPAHYGNYSAHKDAINKHLNDNFDAILFCECDAIFIKPVHVVYRSIMDRLDDMNQYDLYYMSFGKRIPDWEHEAYEYFGVTNRMSEAHCYLLPTDKKRKLYFRKKLKDTKWDTYDLWLNNNIFPDKKCGIVKSPISIQCSGESYLDKSFKDGTTLLTDEELTHETF